MKMHLARTSVLLVCAVALRWASVDHAWALVPALVGVFSVLAFRPPLEWVAGGFLVGLIYTSAIMLALAKWGVVPVLVLWLGLSAAFAVFFGCVGWAASQSKRESASYIVIASVWCAGLFVLDRFVYTPVFISAPLAQHSDLFRNVLGTVGAPAGEALVVLASAAMAFAIRTRSPNPLYSVIPLVTVVVVFASFQSSSEATGRGSFHVVQPNFRWSDYSARGWSFEAKDYLAKTLDDLTRIAVGRGPGTVVWPENGSGVADAQIASRTNTLRSILDGTGSDLVIAGLAYEGSRRMVAATHIHEHGVGQHTSKSKLVPLAESDVHPGTPRVLHTQAGVLGVSVCFDILFGDLVRRLVGQGAEILVVTSDNASFGSSLIPRWHQAYAILRAAEARRSLLFSANRGPAFSFDIATNTVNQHTTRAKKEVATVSLGRSREPSRQRWHLLATVLFCGPLFCLLRPQKRPLRPEVAPVVLAGLFGIVAGPMVELVHVSSVRRVALTEPLFDGLVRARGLAGIDSMRSSFVQSKQQSCGLAALAYAVTLLGDRAFEEHFSDVPMTERGSTLQDLAEAVRQRGFTAETLRAPSVDAIELAEGRVALLHQEPGHYLVASLSPEEGVLIFDPATGSLQPLKSSALRRPWQGAALRVSMKPLSSPGR